MIPKVRFVEKHLREIIIAHRIAESELLSAITTLFEFKSI